jgi:hypothetical protein
MVYHVRPIIFNGDRVWCYYRLNRLNHISLAFKDYTVKIILKLLLSLVCFGVGFFLMTIYANSGPIGIFVGVGLVNVIPLILSY